MIRIIDRHAHKRCVSIAAQLDLSASMLESIADNDDDEYLLDDEYDKITEIVSRINAVATTMENIANSYVITGDD